jgi:hypothetical protein
MVVSPEGLKIIVSRGSRAAEVLSYSVSLGVINTEI